MKTAILAGIVASMFVASSAFALSSQCAKNKNGSAKACYDADGDTITVYDLSSDGKSAEAEVIVYWYEEAVLKSTFITCTDSRGAGTARNCSVPIYRGNEFQVRFRVYRHDVSCGNYGSCYDSYSNYVIMDP